MMRPRKTIEWKKVMRGELFSVFQNRNQTHRFRINWNDRDGNRRRYRLWASSVEEAAEEANRLVKELTPNQPEPELDGRILVVDSFEQALAETKRRDRSRRDWNRAQTRFIEWLAERHPDATHWPLITRRMLREYMLQTLGKASPNHIRLTVQPILQTAGYVEREFNLPNVVKRLGIGNKLKSTPPMVPMTDVVDLLEHLRENDPILEVGAGLQGLAGLQLMEALRLTWDKVDLVDGLIEISGEVKNDYRNRVIPVCGKLLGILRRANQRRSEDKVQVVGPEPVVTSPTGCSYAPETSFRNYYNRFKARLKKWNAMVIWAPKDLRNCLPTFSVTEGLHSDLWEQYIGHAPRTITGRHYVPRLAVATHGERQMLQQQMVHFRKMVVEPIDRAIEKMARKGHDPADQAKTVDFEDSLNPMSISG